MSDKRDKIPKRQITLRVDSASVEYFKRMAEETGISYQNLINLYLRDCVGRKNKIRFDWNDTEEVDSDDSKVQS